MMKLWELRGGNGGTRGKILQPWDKRAAFNTTNEVVPTKSDVRRGSGAWKGGGCRARVV